MFGSIFSYNSQKTRENKNNKSLFFFLHFSSWTINSAKMMVIEDLNLFLVVNNKQI